jgi:hypothetical protein
LGDVTQHTECLVAGAGQVVGRGDHHVGALARECESRDTADVAPRASHEGNLACKASIWLSHCLFLVVGHFTVVVDVWVMGGAEP